MKAVSIYKYQISTLVDGFPIPVEKTATVLDVQEQNGAIVAWILHDISAPKDRVFNFRVFGTGWAIREDISGFNFINTIQMSNGLVWHVFCEIKDNGVNGVEHEQAN